MKQPATKVDKVSIYRATESAKSVVAKALETAEKLKADSEKKLRLKKGLCKACFYLRSPRLGGACFTTRECGICKEPQNYSSTATDTLCLPCANLNQLCKQCGGDIDTKNRRSR